MMSRVIEYNGFNITKSFLISGQFKKKYSSLNALSWKPNIRNTSHSWLNSSIGSAVGSDLHCYDFQNLGILRTCYNNNQPAVDLDYYNRDCYYEDAIPEKF